MRADDPQGEKCNLALMLQVGNPAEAMRGTEFHKVSGEAVGRPVPRLAGIYYVGSRPRKLERIIVKIPGQVAFEGDRLKPILIESAASDGKEDKPRSAKKLLSQ